MTKLNFLNACIRNDTNDPEAGGQFILMAQLNTVDRIRKYLKAVAEAYDAEVPPVVKDCGSSTKSLTSMEAFIATTKKGGGVAKTRSKSSSSFISRVTPPQA